MTTCWSQEEFDGSIPAEREAGRHVPTPPEPLAPVPGPLIDRSLANRVEEEPLLAAGDTRGRAWFIGWAVVVAAMAGMVIVFLLDVANPVVIGSAVTVAGIMAAVGLGRYLLRGRVFARGPDRVRIPD